MFTSEMLTAQFFSLITYNIKYRTKYSVIHMNIFKYLLTKK
jgi:hypothetical protein